MANVRDNVLRVLAHHGLANALDVTEELPDRIKAWPRGHRIMAHVVLCEWPKDLECAAEHFHGEHAVSYREPGGVSPALQIVFHPHAESEHGYFLELDLDEHAPVGLDTLHHAGEVLRNAITRKKTDQHQIARLLDQRFA